MARRAAESAKGAEEQASSLRGRRSLRLPLLGKAVDRETRCVHWHGPLDVVAFRFACCDAWWPCHACHEEAAGHPAVPWPASRFTEPSVLCGVCRAGLSVPEYLAAGDACPRCMVGFNPRCRLHHALYFEGGVK